MTRHNFSTVVSFEVTRTLSKRRFWIATLIVPVVFAIVFLLVSVSNSATTTSVDSQSSARFKFSYSDGSGLISPTLAARLGGKEAYSPADEIAAVKAGRLDAYFAYPREPATQKTRVYGIDKGVFENGKYADVANHLLVVSARSVIGSDRLATLIQGNAHIDSMTFKDGTPSTGLNSVVPPLLFLLVFYLVVLLLGNQMLTATLEEKENRVTEMILTTLNPTTLVVGKIVALYLVGLVQVLVFAVPTVVGYLFFRKSLDLPDFDVSHLVLSPGPMIVGGLLLIAGFTFFTGTLVAVGAIMPTAKDAGQIFGICMALIFVPFYIVTIVVTDPSAPIVQLFTFFPYSAPVMGMLRNGFGSLSVPQSVAIIAELFVLGAAILYIAVRLFRYGSTSYTSRVSLKRAFQSRRG